MPQILTEITDLSSGREERAERRARVAGRHEPLAHEDCIVTASGKARHVFLAGDSALGDANDAAGEEGRHALGDGERDRERAEVAVVDAHDRRAGGDGEGEAFFTSAITRKGAPGGRCRAAANEGRAGAAAARGASFASGSARLRASRSSRTPATMSSRTVMSCPRVAWCRGALQCAPTP